MSHKPSRIWHTDATSSALLRASVLTSTLRIFPCALHRSILALESPYGGSLDMKYVGPLEHHKGVIYPLLLWNRALAKRLEKRFC